MDDGSAPPRVEIELTEHEGKRSRRDRKRVPPTPANPASSGVAAAPWTHAQGSDGAFTPPIDPARQGATLDGPLRSERNRLVVTGLAVGAVALFLGWAIGRSDGDGSARTVDAGTTTTVDDDESARESAGDAGEPTATAATGDTLPAAELPTTTRPRPTTTTTLPPEWVTSVVKIDPRLEGAADRIVAIGADGELIDLDLVTGEVRTLGARQTRASTIVGLIAGDDWAMVSFDDGNAPLVFHDDQVSPKELTLTDPWSTYWEVDTDRFWTVDYSGSFRPTQNLVEIDVENGPTGRSIDLHGLWAMQADPAGGVVVSDSIGTFSVGPDGSRRLADGRLIAIGASHVLMYACGDTIESCGLEVVDRASGAATPVAPLEAPYDELSNLGGWWGASPSRPTLSPDGTGALTTVVSNVGAPESAVIDLTTSEVTTFDSHGNVFSYPSAAWSGDGRFVYVVDGSTLTAFEPATGESFPVVLGDVFPDVRTVTIRPPAAG